MAALSDIYLQEATEADSRLLFEWVNDPVARRNAFQTAYIPYEKHMEWFHNILNDHAVKQYILYYKGIPVGQVRLNIEDGIGLIDYSIAPDMRGQGFGVLALNLIQERAKKEITEIIKLVGQVKYENTASIKVFEHCGYVPRKEKEYIIFTLDLRQ